MQVNLVDRISFDANAGMKRTANDGYLVAMPRVARSGIQLYRGSELGIKDKAVVRVYRPPEEVFHPDAMKSLTHRPLTNDHPPEPVTSDNWKKYAVGQAGDEAIRDGDFVRVPMVFMDGEAIKAIEGGKKQLSVGYSCDLIVEDGIVADGPHKGEKYDAKQTKIIGNHHALCDMARGGDRLSIGDAGAENFGKDVADAAAFDLLVGATVARIAIGDGKVKHDEITDEAGDLFLGDGYPFGKGGYVYASLLKSTRQRASDKGEAAIAKAADDLLKLFDTTNPNGGTMPKVLMIDGVNVEFVTDQSAQIAERAIASRDTQIKTITDKGAADLKALNDKLNETTASVTTLTTDKATLTAENATLKQQVKDAELTPAKLDALVAERSEINGKAAVIMGDKLVTDGKTATEVRRQVVDFKLGDAAKGWSDEQVAISFATLTAGVKATDSRAVHDTRQAFMHPGYNGSGGNVQDQNAKAAMYDKADQQLSERWKGPQAATH